MRRSFEPVRSRSASAPRSRRLPFYPGCPVPVIALRGRRYPSLGVTRRDFAVRRGWLVDLCDGPFCPAGGSAFSSVGL